MQKVSGDRIGQSKQSYAACHTEKKAVPDRGPYHTADRFPIDRTGGPGNPRASIRRQPHGRKRDPGQRDGHGKPIYGHHEGHQSHRFRADFPGNIRLKAHADHAQYDIHKGQQRDSHAKRPFPGHSTPPPANPAYSAESLAQHTAILLTWSRDYDTMSQGRCVLNKNALRSQIADFDYCGITRLYTDFRKTV